jgi:eukaryotic-like serine/threonine-protein kinase
METRWGKRFGRYEILGEVGRGAMGVVYKARDPKIDRFVAVKAISLAHQNPEEDRDYRERFFLEAQAAGRLLHPGIVTIFDTGEDPESHMAFIVMEFVAGQSLDQRLSQEPKKLSLDTALLLTEELAEALDHAHGQGVIHRDMKPANVLVTAEGHAKIADFGIAKMNNGNMTLPGRALGTPAYMSPEQLDGEPVDNRSDVFSLGALLYRMVTGYGPFQGNSATTVCFKVANREPLRATALDPDLPAALDAIIARAMAKDPGQRYQRALEFALDVHELRQNYQDIATKTSSVTRSSTAEGGAIPDRNSAANLAPSSFPEAAARHAKKAFSSIAQLGAFCWRRPIISAGLAILLATVILSLFAYRKNPQPPRSAPIRPASTFTTDGEPPPPASKPDAVAQNLSKVAAAKAPQAVPDSILNVRVEHRFSAADLSLWIDNNLVYERPLRDQGKKRWNLFRTDARESQTIPVAAGAHRIRVRVRSTPDKYVQSAVVVGSFSKDHPTILQINFERQGNAMHLTLR